MALEAVGDYTVLRVPLGNISRFGDLRLWYTQTLADFGTVIITPLSTAFPSATVHDGIMTLPGGRLYSPWSLAGKRAPVTYPRYSQQFVYRGHTDACLRHYGDLLYYAGLTRVLYFSYGRQTYDPNDYHDGDDYGAKHCQAMLLSVTAPMEHDLNTKSSRLTHFIVTAVWQQVGDFQATL